MAGYGTKGGAKKTPTKTKKTYKTRPTLQDIAKKMGKSDASAKKAEKDKKSPFKNSFLPKPNQEKRRRVAKKLIEIKRKTQERARKKK